MGRRFAIAVVGFAMLLAFVVVTGQATPRRDQCRTAPADTVVDLSQSCSVNWTGPYFDKTQKQYYYYATNTCSRGVLCSIWNERVKYSKCVPRKSTRKIHIGRFYRDQPFRREATFHSSCP